MKSLILLLLTTSISAVVVIHEGGSCGTNSIPYKMIVDAEGKPEILCDAPTCLGVDYSESERNEKPSKQLSVSCDPFKEIVCVDELQWTGGLLEVNNGTHRTLKTECCSYDGMSNAQTIKSIFLGPGDVYVGGMVEKDGEYGGFDLIKEIRKTVNADNQVQYILSVYRLPCILIPEPEQALPVLTRNRRRLRDRLDDYEEETYRPYPANFRRRSFNARRRALLKRLEDYYDYDYEIPQMRRPLRRSRLPYTENSLWPVQYKKPRAYSDSTYQESSLQGMQDGSASVVNSYADNSIETGPVPPAAPQILESQNIAPANNYQTAQTELVPPPADNYQTNYVQPSYNSYPAYNAYPTANQYSGYPSQQYAVAQPSAQSSYNYPSSYQYNYAAQPNLNSVFSRTPFQCFSGDMEVETEEGVKLMKDIRVGDKILSLDGAFLTYSPVIMFLHKRHDEEAEFNVIETVDGHSLKLTDNHLIYISQCSGRSDMRLVAAKEVKIDDCVHVTNEQNLVIKNKVTNIRKVAGTGIYSPLTSTGDVIVNRVLASCHSNLALKSVQQTFFTCYKRTSSFLSSIFSSSDDGHLPFGVESLTSVIDIFFPQSFV